MGATASSKGSAAAQLLKGQQPTRAGSSSSRRCPALRASASLPPCFSRFRRSHALLASIWSFEPPSAALRANALLSAPCCDASENKLVIESSVAREHMPHRNFIVSQVA